MRPEHRRPLIAAVVVLIACAGIVAHAMRTDALGVVARPMRVLAAEVVDPVAPADRSPRRVRAEHDAPVVPTAPPADPTSASTSATTPSASPSSTPSSTPGSTRSSGRPTHPGSSAPAHQQPEPPAGDPDHPDHGLHLGHQGETNDGTVTAGDGDGDSDGDSDGDHGDAAEHGPGHATLHGHPWWTHPSTEDWRAAPGQLLRAVRDLARRAGISPPWEPAPPTR